MLSKLNISRLDAYWIYLLIQGTQSLALGTVFVVNMVYQVTQVGLNPLQLILVGTALELTAFLFEIPTGIVADVYSRRLSVIIGYALLGLAIIIEGSFPIFEVLLFSAFVAGVGYTFLSGATSAWIVDEIGQERATVAFLRASQIGQVLGFVGILLAITLASISLQLAIVTGGFMLVALSLLLILIMPEEGFQRVPKSERETWSDFLSTFRKGLTLVRGRRILILIMLITIIHGAFSEGFDRLWTAHLLTNFTLPSLGELNQIVWFGLISAVSIPLTLVATEWIRRRVDLTDSNAISRTLMIVYLLLISSLLVFALGGEFWMVLIGLWVTGTLRAVIHPLMEAWINQHTESNVRATVLSMAGQADAFGQIAGGPVVGLIGTLTSVRVALTISALMLTPIIGVFRRTNQPETA